MKNQYLCDINDFRKYALLRALAARGIRWMVAWMLTPGDGRTDGRKTGYLSAPHLHRHHDPELFDGLARIHACHDRRVEHIANSGLIPRALFHHDLLGDSAEVRSRWFRALWEKSPDTDAVFFDPDNGFEVKSKPFGRRDSSKYLYWHEFADAWRRGHSVLVYQHYPRVERTAYRAVLKERIAQHAPGAAIAAFHSPNVVFFFAAQPRHHQAASGARNLPGLELA